MSAITCSKCGSPNRAGAKFCAKCRTPLASPPPAPIQPPVTPRQPPVPTPPSVTPRQLPVPLPVTPRQPPVPPVTPRQPPQAAHPPARRNFFTRGRIVGGVLALVLLCVCATLVFVLLSPQLQLAGWGATPTVRVPTSLPTLPVSSPVRKPAVPSVTPVTVLPETPVPPVAPAQPTVTVVQPPPAQPTAVPTDTPPGLTLRPGESWRTGTQVMTLQNPKFAGTTCGAILEFEVVFENTDAREVVVSLRGQDWGIIDERAQSYETFFWQGTKPADCNGFVSPAALEKGALAAREKYQVGLQVRGKLADEVKQLQFHVNKAGRITGAKWEIAVPR